MSEVGVRMEFLWRNKRQFHHL